MARPAKLAATMMMGLIMVASASAQESNRNEVRANLDKGWSVIWGKNFTEADWARGTKAIAESVATENPGPFLNWFGQTLDENFTKIERNLEGVSKRDLQRWVLQSLKSKNIIRFKNFRIEAGFATYNRWKVVIYHEPRTRKKKVSLPLGGWTYVVETYTAKVEKKISLPNWHQFYIRYQVVTSSGNTNPGPKPSPSPAEVKISYKLVNRSGRTVRFQLPSGKIYELADGRYGTFNNKGVPGTMKIKVLDTGRRYKLSSGEFKFFWMSKEKRIGFRSL